MTKYEIETALSQGHFWAAMRNGRYWLMRRNGATRTWKTRPADFSVPVKCGLKTCTRITQQSSVALLGDDNWRAADFLISVDDPNTMRTQLARVMPVTPMVVARNILGGRKPSGSYRPDPRFTDDDHGV